MKCRAVLFDLDGTLLDTLADIANAANSVLEHLGFPTHDVEAYRAFVGEGLKALYGRVLPAARREPELIIQCTEAFRAAYEQHWNRHTKPYDGIPELLDALEARRLKMAVLSNKPDRFAKLCVDEYFPELQFEVVLGQGEKVPAKPDPSGARQVAQQIGLPPEAILYLGDTGTDIETARTARMHPVGAKWGFRPAEELQAAGAIALIEHPMQLLDVLDGSIRG